jgi:hypothetical protein
MFRVPVECVTGTYTGLSFIVTMIMTALPHRKLASAATSLDSCGAQGVENKGLIVVINVDKQRNAIVCCDVKLRFF